MFKNKKLFIALCINTALFIAVWKLYDYNFGPPVETKNGLNGCHFQVLPESMEEDMADIKEEWRELEQWCSSSIWNQRKPASIFKSAYLWYYSDTAEKCNVFRTCVKKEAWKGLFLIFTCAFLAFGFALDVLLIYWGCLELEEKKRRVDPRREEWGHRGLFYRVERRKKHRHHGLFSTIKKKLKHKKHKKHKKKKSRKHKHTTEKEEKKAQRGEHDLVKRIQEAREQTAEKEEKKAQRQEQDLEKGMQEEKQQTREKEEQTDSEGHEENQHLHAYENKKNKKAIYRYLKAVERSALKKVCGENQRSN